MHKTGIADLDEMLEKIRTAPLEERKMALSVIIRMCRVKTEQLEKETGLWRGLAEHAIGAHLELRGKPKRKGRKS